MAVALAALIVALGGTSYAATKLPNNSVSARQIKNNSVTSPKVKDRSLKAQDFAPGALPAGARGPLGEPGPQGERGLSGEPGAQGERGAQGETGTVDTSNFFTKSESDSRFVRGVGTRSFRQVGVAAGGASGSLFFSIGTLEVSCSDPASATVRFRMGPSNSGGIFTDDGTGTTTHESVTANNLSTPVTAPTTRHAEWFVGSGVDSVGIDAWIVAGPGGANLCLVEAIVHTS